MSDTPETDYVKDVVRLEPLKSGGFSVIVGDRELVLTHESQSSACRDVETINQAISGVVAKMEADFSYVYKHQLEAYAELRTQMDKLGK